MKKVKYLVNNHDGEDTDIRVEDGGIVSMYHNGDNFVTNYYQNRNKEVIPNWDELGEGKMYVKDWDSSIDEVTDEMIQDALNWLFMSTEDFEFVKVETLEELFN